ncbi:MAG: hypothetical protein JWL59_4828 [Chthoniobacteraceae bacterium]|nr:hypothetical protein [Chthoniobacteraceae bacterium]
MDRAVPDCLVTGHMKLVDCLSLPDPDERHVLAAAICGHVEVIVTFNEKDFPHEILAELGVEAQHPDEFISHLMTVDWSAVCRALKNQHATLRNPPRTAEDLLDILEKQGLPLTVSQLRPLAELI